DEQWLRLAIAARGHRQNSFLVDKQQPAAIGREARGISRTDLMRHAAGRGNHPYFLGHWAFRGVINVGRSLILKTLAPREGDRRRIRRPGEFADIETVVLCVRCDLSRFRAMGWVCYPDITAALRVEYPRHGCARGRGHHVVRKWRLHHIVECKSRWMGSRSLRHEYAFAGCCRAPEPQLSQTEVNHVSSGFPKLLALCNGEPIIPQVHYHHNDVAVYARFCYSLEEALGVL